MHAKRILELGSGAGFLGLIVAAVQTRSTFLPLENRSALWLTDVNDAVLQVCQRNVRLTCSAYQPDLFEDTSLNRIFLDASSRHPNIRVSPLDWTDAGDGGQNMSMRTWLSEVDPDLVLGADIVSTSAFLTSRRVLTEIGV